MKTALFLGALWTGRLLAKPSDEALLRSSFEGMFEPPVPLPIADVRAAEPMPPVPLDGGVVLLILGGIAVARTRLAR
jgi:hypothetical protein